MTNNDQNDYAAIRNGALFLTVAARRQANPYAEIAQCWSSAAPTAANAVLTQGDLERLVAMARVGYAVMHDKAALQDQARADMQRLAGEDLSGEPDAWGSEADVHNHRPYHPSCPETRVNGALRGECIGDNAASGWVFGSGDVGQGN